MNYYLGVDVGTSSVKSLLMDSEGKTVGTSQIGYDIIKEKLQYAEQDMEKLWEATKETITDLVKRYPEESAKIHGISYSGQMHGLVMIGADGKLILKKGVVLDADGEIRYYVDNKPVYAGLVQDSEGNYYYISGNTNAALKNCTRYITYTNGLLPAGTYRFGADGRIILD